jgi:hypothetical protein
MRTNYTPGQKLQHVSADEPIEIVDVRPTGYGWKYPEFGEELPNGGENYWWSDNSTDPFFELDWRVVP